MASSSSERVCDVAAVDNEAEIRLSSIFPPLHSREPSRECSTVSRDAELAAWERLPK